MCPSSLISHGRAPWCAHLWPHSGELPPSDRSLQPQAATIQSYPHGLVRRTYRRPADDCTPMSGRTPARRTAARGAAAAPHAGHKSSTPPPPPQPPPRHCLLSLRGSRRGRGVARGVQGPQQGHRSPSSRRALAELSPSSRRALAELSPSSRQDPPHLNGPHAVMMDVLSWCGARSEWQLRRELKR